MISEAKNLDNWISIYFKFYLTFGIIEVIINYVHIDNIKLLAS